MAKAIYCDCGLVCRGDSDDELLQAAQRHLRDEHPALAGRVRAEDLLAMAVEVAPPAPAQEVAAPSGRPLDVARDGPTAVVTLNRPERRNALSSELIDLLRREVGALGRDPAVTSVVIAGAGPAFCSGHDLEELRDCDEASARELFEADADLIRRLRSLPQPVVARVHGAAWAGGCHLAAACDLVIASPAATFAVPGPALGLPGTTAMVELARVVGRQRAMWMLLTGSPVAAETALAWGLVSRVVPAEELGAASVALARSVSAGAPGAVATGKRWIHESLDLDLDEACRRASELMWRAVPGPEAQEGIAAFLDKRPPSWPARPG